MRIITPFYIAFFILSLLYSCSGSYILPTELPPPSQSGENILGFLKDGEIWVHQQERASGEFRIAKFQDDCLEIHAFRKDRNDAVEMLNVKICEFVGEGVYEFVLTPDGPERSVVFFRNNWEYKLLGGDLNFGTLTITRFDFEQGVISGVFEFDVYASLEDRIQIRSGRFDAKM
jgi:hypothetical protein